MNNSVTRPIYFILPTDLLIVFKKNEELVLTILNPIIGIICIIGNLIMICYLLTKLKSFIRNPTRILLLIFNLINIYSGIILIWFAIVLKTTKVLIKVNLLTLQKTLLRTGNLAIFFGSNLFIITITSIFLSILAFDQLLVCFKKRNNIFKIITFKILIGSLILCLMVGIRITNICPNKYCYEKIGPILFFFVGIFFQLIFNIITIIKLNTKNHVVFNIQSTNIENSQDIQGKEENYKGIFFCVNLYFLIFFPSLEKRDDNIQMVKFLGCLSILTFLISIPSWLSNFRIIENTSLLIYSSIFMNSIWCPIFFYIYYTNFKQFINYPFNRLTKNN